MFRPEPERRCSRSFIRIDRASGGCCLARAITKVEPGQRHHRSRWCAAGRPCRSPLFFAGRDDCCCRRRSCWRKDRAPSAIAVPGGVSAAVLQEEGAQIYQFEHDSRNQIRWQPREPIATLILDGDTVGRHSGGLHWGHIDETRLRWEHADGSTVQARIVASAPAAGPDDIPWLRLEVISQTGNGASGWRDGRSVPKHARRNGTGIVREGRSLFECSILSRLCVLARRLKHLSASAPQNLRRRQLSLSEMIPM